MVLLETPPPTRMVPPNSPRVQDQSEHKTPSHREHSRSHRNSSLGPSQRRQEAPLHSERSNKTRERSHRDSTRRATHRASSDTRDQSHQSSRTPTQRFLEGPRASEASRTKNTLARSHTTRETTGRSERTHDRRGTTRPSVLPNIPERSSRQSGTEPGLVTRITDGIKDIVFPSQEESSLGRIRCMRDSSRYGTGAFSRGESSRTITPSRYGSGPFTRGDTGMSMMPSCPSFMDSNRSRMPSFATSGRSRSRSRSMLPPALSMNHSKFRPRSSSFSDWSNDEDDFDDYDDYDSGPPRRGPSGKPGRSYTAVEYNDKGEIVNVKSGHLTDTQVGQMADRAEEVKWGTNDAGKVQVKQFGGRDLHQFF